jgi:glycosyltransferase involved in cell wall biosynthesis
MNIGFDAKRVFHNTTGLGNYGRDLVRIINESFPENKFLLYNPKPKKINRFQFTEQTLEVLPKSKFWKKFSSIWRQGPIVTQLKDDNIDVFHGLSGEIPRGLKDANIKSIVTIHDLIFIRFPELYSFFDRRIHYNKFLYAAKNADKIVAISEQTKNDIVDFLKIDEEKIEVIYQSCHDVFKASQSEVFKKEVLKKYNLPSKFILNVGRIEKRKNALSIIKAIKNIDIPLVIVGNKKTYFKEVETYIATNNLEHRIFFLEGLSLEELAALYKLSTIFIYPSLFEGFGIPIIEALYSKTPVITSKGSCFPEAGGPNSIYVNPENISEMESQINFLLNNPLEMERIAEKGHEFVQKFNNESIASSYMKLYQETIHAKI